MSDASASSRVYSKFFVITNDERRVIIPRPTTHEVSGTFETDGQKPLIFTRYMLSAHIGRFDCGKEAFS